MTRGFRADLKAAADAEGIALEEGVYAWYSGPSFETPAEISAPSGRSGRTRSACPPFPR